MVARWQSYLVRGIMIRNSKSAAAKYKGGGVSSDNIHYTCVVAAAAKTEKYIYMLSHNYC